MSDEDTGLTPAQQQVVKWLANGEVGVSSETMAMWLAFGQRCRRSSHPHDPDDLDRCLKLLAMAPALRPLLGRMEKVSREWRDLVRRWDEIEASHIAEVGIGWTIGRSAPKTYALMREIIERKKPCSNHCA